MRVVLGGVVAVDDASLHVASGRCVALVGESGAGKTTLLRCFNRLVTPAAGTVMVGGIDVMREQPAELRRLIGYVPQKGGLLPHWTVLRNAALVPTLLGRDDAIDAARTALDLVGLPATEYAKRFPHELSGGQRQRVALARALAARPGVLLMDEPFAALDAVLRALAERVVPDGERWAACYAADGQGSRTAAASAAARQLAVRATPTFFVNGQMVEGALPLAAMREGLGSMLGEKTAP